MTEGTEHALEIAAAGILFCAAFAMLVLLHATVYRQAECMGWQPERLILYEEDTWKPLVD